MTSNVFFHLHPVKVSRKNIRWSYSFGLGVITAILFGVLVFTGVPLMFYYVPSGERAYPALKEIQLSVPLGQFTRNMHRWSAHLMVLMAILHMARVFYTGAYKPPREFNWIVGVGVLVLTLGASFTGYLLPWDQLAYWAITVGTNIASYAPVAGPAARELGEVTLLPSDDSRVSIDGQVLFADELEYQVNTAQDQIVIKVLTHRNDHLSPPLRLFVHVPKQLQVKVETDKASVLVQRYQGNLEVDSISGNITVEQMSGGLTAYSNRGNISVQDSSGIISIVGNYGALTMRNTSGEMSASTIMGNVLFDGLIQAGDKARLEADHGSVSVDMTADSALGVQVRSTSGDVTCILPGVSSTTRTCDGT